MPVDRRNPVPVKNTLFRIRFIIPTYKCRAISFITGYALCDSMGRW